MQRRAGGRKCVRVASGRIANSRACSSRSRTSSSRPWNLIAICSSFEEELFPSNTQLAVYLSLDVDELFALDAVKLSIDGEVVTNYLYTERQLDALQRGGVQRLYMGNLKTGEHEIVAVFTGHPRARLPPGNAIAPGKSQWRQEYRAEDFGERDMQQPDFAVKEW